MFGNIKFNPVFSFQLVIISFGPTFFSCGENKSQEVRSALTPSCHQPFRQSCLSASCLGMCSSMLSLVSHPILCSTWEEKVSGGHHTHSSATHSVNTQRQPERVGDIESNGSHSHLLWTCREKESGRQEIIIHTVVSHSLSVKCQPAVCGYKVQCFFWS